MSGKCKIYWGLWPFSALYGIGVKVRNLLFDVGWLREERFPLPVICIGNLTVGGTGKTPHTEYLIRLLQDSFRLAVLSRGYKRKSKGFVLASSISRMKDIGDEPYQMAQQ
jgi:tetraacyldisaccharide 4'-kinase